MTRDEIEYEIMMLQSQIADCENQINEYNKMHEKSDEELEEMGWDE